MKSIGRSKRGCNKGHMRCVIWVKRVNGVEVVIFFRFFSVLGSAALHLKKMKMVGRNWEENSDIPFKIWRKFAVCKSIGFDSWEEGNFVRVHGDHNVFLNFR